MTTAISPSNSRGMGWRKPVPVFIPTPPVSRPTSDTIFKSLVSAEGIECKSTAAAPPPVSRLFILLSLRRTFFVFSKMPDRWRNVIENVTRDVRRDSSRFQRGAGSVIREPEPVYVVSHLCPRWCSAMIAWPLNDSPRGGSRGPHPLRRTIATPGLALCARVLSQGYAVPFSLYRGEVTHNTRRLTAPRPHLSHLRDDPCRMPSRVK